MTSRVGHAPVADTGGSAAAARRLSISAVVNARGKRSTTAGAVNKSSSVGSTFRYPATGQPVTEPAPRRQRPRRRGRFARPAQHRQSLQAVVRGQIRQAHTSKIGLDRQTFGVVDRTAETGTDRSPPPAQVPPARQRRVRTRRTRRQLLRHQPILRQLHQRCLQPRARPLPLPRCCHRRSLHSAGYVGCS